MTRIVVSAVNFTEGGPLTVLRDCLAAATAVLPKEWELIALVHSTALVSARGVRLIPVAGAKKSWLRRLYWEWIGFHSLSRKLAPSLWLSLHDITPRVEATRQAVYCHNPSPFYRISLREAWLEPRFLLFNKFYSLLYGVLIRRNRFVIVQQEWLRQAFQRRYSLINIVVAHPTLPVEPKPQRHASGVPFIFLYPTFPRVFKNIELLLAAAEILLERNIKKFEIRVTIEGSENRYARYLRKKNTSESVVKFIGRQSADQMASEYGAANALVFPSKLETWGLPITEAKAFELPILAADLPYARETVGSYESVSFFGPKEPAKLADLMEHMIKKTWQPSGRESQVDSASLFARNWEELWLMLVQDLK